MAACVTGADGMAARGFADLVGLRVGFVGNHTSRLKSGSATHAAIHAADGVRLVKLFSPEHGAFGLEDREGIGDGIDPQTGLTIHSLYGETRIPTPEMLSGLDALVFELQDVGARFYTYASTMLLCLEAAHSQGIRLYVLDRPNPIGGAVEGPIADADRLSFTACHPVPVRHGLTLGELARIAAAQRGLSEALTVLPCSGWRRSMWWDDTGLAWTPPSPAMRSLHTATVYPGVCLLEQSNVSVGRGTSTPFEIVGAPWIDSDAWAAETIPDAGAGVAIAPCVFTPAADKFAGELCRGVRLSISERNLFEPVRAGLSLIAALRHIHPDRFDIAGVDRLLVSRNTLERLLAACPVPDIVAGWQPHLASWRDAASAHQIYD